MILLQLPPVQKTERYSKKKKKKKLNLILMNQDKENLLSGYHIVKNFNNNKEKNIN